CFEQSLRVADDQQLSLDGTTLQLTADTGTVSVDLSAFLDGTDNQQLSRTGDSLQLTSDDGTDTVDLSDLANRDAPTLSFSGDTLTISGSGSQANFSTYMKREEVVSLLRNVLGSSRRTVFLSSRSYFPAELGGLAGADAKCQQLAEAEGLPGVFFAWLSDSSESPATRFVRGDRPFHLVNGGKVADGWDDLVDGSIEREIVVTENGTDYSEIGVLPSWTGTDASGNAVGEHCEDWTSSSGSARVGHGELTDARWSSAFTQSCDRPRQLYCFEQTGL
ncbi:MAG: hypothetical protein AAFX50_24200, partial [Acidobacteriota bacterium]